MRTIALNQNNLDQVAADVARVIAGGGVVIAPFDTVYGLICDPYNDEALEKIYDFKDRDRAKTIGLALFGSIINFITTSESLPFVMDRIPGPYTFILPLRDKKISKYCQHDGTVAIRVPKSELILKISQILDKPIAQTSCNKSGRETCDSIEKILNQFSENELNLIELMVDGGQIENAKPSQIFDLSGDSPREIVR